MDKSFIFRKPTAYNLSGTLKAMPVSPSSHPICLEQKEMLKYYSEKGPETYTDQYRNRKTETKGKPISDVPKPRAIRRDNP